MRKINPSPLEAIKVGEELEMLVGELGDQVLDLEGCREELPSTHKPEGIAPPSWAATIAARTFPCPR
jgi:hypothetical protein